MNAEERNRNHGFSPREVIDTIIQRGEPAKRGLRPYIEALAYARWQNWEKLETEQYVKLGVLLDRVDGDLDTDVADRLWTEMTHTRITEDVDVVLRVLLSALEHLSEDSPAVRGFTRVFEARTESVETAWPTRAYVGRFLDRLSRVDAALADERRAHLTTRVADWSLEYHDNDTLGDFEVRSRGMFDAILAAAWRENAFENVERGLDGAMGCAIDKLVQAVRLDWFDGFVGQLSERLCRMEMFRRLSAPTLSAITSMFSETRRRVYERFPRAAVSITTLEEAMHRPRRVQLEHTPMQLEMELPGPRGFGDDAARLRVFDISRDGCLAMIEGAAHFEETAPGEEFRINRGRDRNFVAHRLSGVVQREDGGFNVQPGTEVIFYDVTNGGGEWAAVDRASVVRCSRDEENNRLWLGFHFDRVIPEVQQDIEQFVYNAA